MARHQSREGSPSEDSPQLVPLSDASRDLLGDLTVLLDAFPDEIHCWERFEFFGRRGCDHGCGIREKILSVMSKVLRHRARARMQSRRAPRFQRRQS